MAKEQLYTSKIQGKSAYAAAKTARNGFASTRYSSKDIEERFKVYKEIPITKHSTVQSPLNKTTISKSIPSIGQQ
jgi:hypothetical protein